MEKNELNNENSDSVSKEFKVFSNNDEKLKFLGKILNNDSSREIFQILIEKEMTANEIATQMQLSLPLALYHINQMIKSGIVVISKTSTNGKKQPMKHYSAKPGIIILPEKASQKAKNSKSFSKSLKSIMKFTVIGVAGIVSWVTVKVNNQELPIQEPTNEITDIYPSIPLDRIVIPNPGITTSADSVESLIISILIPVVIVVSGITLERIITKWIGKRRQKIDDNIN
ncbi:ArsR/SmtB family transcription factor [Nitrosopumilus sp.]|uniref:ArsR/SmtB family transcription factor n=1 Tax=Nitrosopumilus sp. TaxID=2024843 RepID=UPI0034A076A7